MVFLLLFGTSILSQNPIRDLTKSKLEVDQKMTEIEQLLADYELKANDSLALFYQDYAYWLYDHDIEKTIEYENKALQTALSKEPLDTLFVQRSATYLGFYYSVTKDFLRSNQAYNRVLDYNNSNNWTRSVYSKLGLGFLQMNNYPKAISYLKVAKSKYDTPQTKRDKATLNEILQNISVAQRKLVTEEGFKQAIKNGELADSLSQEIKAPNRTKFNIKFNLAQLHNEYLSLDFDRSLAYHNQALNLAEEHLDTTSIRNVYLSLGNLYNVFNVEKSLDALNKAETLTKMSDSLFRYQIYSSKGHTYSLAKDFEKSLEYRHLGLKLLMGNDFSQVEDIPYLKLVEIPYKTNLLHSVPQLAETYLAYYEENNNPKFLDKALEYFMIADKLIDLLRLNSDQFISRLFWRRVSSEIYGKAIHASYLKGDTEKAFYFMEKDKALLLLEDIAQNKYKQSLEYPKGHFKKEDSIKELLVVTRFQLKESNLSKNTASTLYEKEIALERELSNLTKSYAGADTQLNTPNITPLRKAMAQMDENQLKIEYYISKDDGFGIYPSMHSYILVYDNKNVEFLEIPDINNLEDEVRQLIGLMQQPFQGQSEVDLYRKLAFKVYNKLFPSEVLKEKIEGKNLTIIPDRFLSFLPFEALSSAEDEIQYLIKNTEFHYVYSQSFLDQTTITSSNSKSVGFAPIQFKDDQLSELEYSKNEIQILYENYKGHSYTGSEATKQRFTKNLKDYGIIHLATHASAQDSIAPWIAFQDGKMYLDELYLYPNSASLVVLSGCNTSLGIEETGEGIMSLARGFFYAGSSSVISTLWNVDDKSSSELISTFYTNLSEGQTKAESLHAAKIEYLNTHSFTEVSPHFWASYILMGTNDTIPSTSFPWWIIIIGIAVVSIYFLKKRKTTR